MTYEEFQQRFNKYLIKQDDFRPRFVEVENIEDLDKLKTNLPMGFQILDAEKFCRGDFGLNVPELEQSISDAQGRVLLSGITTMLKLQGKDVLERFLKHMAEKSFANAKIVILCYQCKEFLNFHDPRAKLLVLSIDGKPDHHGMKLVLLSPDIPLILPEEVTCNSFAQLARRVEGTSSNTIYIRTKRKKDHYSNVVQYIIQDYSGAFDVLCAMYPDMRRSLQASYGTEKQWCFLLKLLQKAKVNSWLEYVRSHYPLAESILHVWSNSDEKTRWIVFLALKSNAASTQNWCLAQIAEKATSVDDLLASAYKSILDLDSDTVDYWKKYDDRKIVLRYFCPKDDEPLEAEKFVNMAMAKGKDALYWMTNLTHKEQEAIFYLLNDYGQDFSFSHLDDLLGHIYPELHAYLVPYHFSWDFLNFYFQEYKYSKLTNHITKEIYDMMEKQAISRDYYSELPTRTEKTEAISMNNAEVWFMDAMGGEYLGYILAECQELHMHAKVTVCHCELPSTTHFNTEFLKIFERNNVVCHNVKDLDEIKHHGKHDYDYQKVKVPIHLSEELNIIYQALHQIYNKLYSNEIKTGIMIADHGATRLAIINQENVQPIDMGTKGEHNGRVCAYEEGMDVPDFVTISDTLPRYCCLANYDRFKGGRAAEVETHGGATLEEVVVPIIEFTVDNIDYSGIRLVSEIIQFKRYKRNAKISIISPVKLRNCRILWNGKLYKAAEGEGTQFTFALPDLQKAGKYVVDLYVDDNLVMKGLTFTAVSQGMQVNKDFL